MANRIGTNRAAHASVALVIATVMSGLAKADDFKPVTQEVLNNPPAADWLMISRTYDEQRYSPLTQINRNNVKQLQLAFARDLPRGSQESTPIVHDGVMYMIAPGASLLAIDATSGDQVWEYKRENPKDLAT